MNLSDLRTEMVSRGAEDNQTRNDRWLNLGYRLILNAFDWPFSEATVNGLAGTGTISIGDFRKAQYVTDISGGKTPGRPLEKITYTELVEDFSIENFALTGTPQFWYWDGVAQTIKSYPLGGTLHIRYQKRVDSLTTLDEPIFDEEYHLLIADRAMVEVHKDNEDLEAASSQLAMFLQDLGRMAQDYQVHSRAHSFIQVGEPYDG
jgi:hypothetical protein